MGRIRIRVGACEVEVDSRDFYVDNGSLGQAIAEIASHLQNAAPAVPESAGLGALDNAEVHEPEFSAPSPVSAAQIKSRLDTLAGEGFFDRPRTVSETVSQLMEHGWTASPLDVSRALARMALQRQMARDSAGSKNYYSLRPEPAAV